MFNKLKTSSPVTALIYIIAGIWLIVSPLLPLRIICIVLGLIFLVQGIMRIVAGVKGEKSNSVLIFGIIITIIGLAFVSAPDFIINLFPMLLGIYITVEGITEIVRTFELKHQDSSRWLPALIAAVAITVVGLILIFSPQLAIKWVLRIAGIALLIEGLSTFFSK